MRTVREELLRQGGTEDPQQCGALAGDAQVTKGEGEGEERGGANRQTERQVGAVQVHSAGMPDDVLVPPEQVRSRRISSGGGVRGRKDDGSPGGEEWKMVQERECRRTTRDRREREKVPEEDPTHQEG